MQNKSSEAVIAFCKALDNEQLELLYSRITKKNADPNAIIKEFDQRQSIEPIEPLVHFSLKLLSNAGNSKIFEVSTNPPSDKFVLRFSPTLDSIPEDKLNDLGDKGIIAPRFFFHSLPGELNISLLPLYDSDLHTYLSGQFPKDAQIDSNTKILTCLPRFQTMGQMLLTIQNNNIIFPDAKIKNWLINGNSLIIADTKSLRLFDKLNEHTNLDVTPKMMAPETQKLSRPLSKENVDKIHVYLLAINIIVGMNPHETDKYLGKSPKELKEIRTQQIQSIENAELQQLLNQCIDDNPNNRPSLQLAQMQLKKIELEIKHQQQPMNTEITSALENISRIIKIEKLKKKWIDKPILLSQLSKNQMKRDTNNEFGENWELFIDKLIELYENKKTVEIAQHISETVERLQNPSYNFFSTNGKNKALKIQDAVAKIDTKNLDWKDVEQAFEEKRGWFTSNSAERFRLMKKDWTSARKNSNDNVQLASETKDGENDASTMPNPHIKT